ncbi:hypothetical protein CVULP_1320 [Campylobacter vulpis]|nr:hypothetical protein CVULP_1320 [Campylobacter vulpis]
MAFAHSVSFSAKLAFLSLSLILASNSLALLTLHNTQHSLSSKKQAENKIATTALSKPSLITLKHKAKYFYFISPLKAFFFCDKVTHKVFKFAYNATNYI